MRTILRDVRLVVRDFEPMQDRAHHMLEMARHAAVRYSPQEVGETVDFLDWLMQLNFVLLGYREYELVDTAEGRAIRAVPGSGLGILSDVDRSSFAEITLLDSLDPGLRRRIEDGDLLGLFSKTNAYSTVHRRARMDYIGVRRVSADGEIVGEARLIGLFTSKAYMEPATKTPLLHHKLEQILTAEDLIPGRTTTRRPSSSSSRSRRTSSSRPRRRSCAGSSWGCSSSRSTAASACWCGATCTDAASRSSWRCRAIGSTPCCASVSSSCSSSGSTAPPSTTTCRWARRRPRASSSRCTSTPACRSPRFPTRSSSRRSSGWRERGTTICRTRWIKRVGSAAARPLAERYAPRFPNYYKANEEWGLIADDVLALEGLESNPEGFVVGLGNESTGERLTRVKLYKTGGKVDLSAFMPILEALGLRAVEEIPTAMLGEGKVYIHDFGVLDARGAVLDLERSAADRVAETIGAVWRGEAESDSLNRLVVSGGLSWRQVAILRAYRKYRQRVSTRFTEEYQNDAFAENPDDLGRPDQPLRGQVRPTFDRHCRRYRSSSRGHRRCAAIGCFIGPGSDPSRDAGHDRRHGAHERLPGPRLSFVQAPLGRRARHAEALPALRDLRLLARDGGHPSARGGMVARGGIRWSDRREDYRTEVLGLMKAQKVKNAVIVPDGSKGGFILKRTPASLPTC